MTNVELYTFNVGQGLFNLLTATTDDGMPYSAVFDCGNCKSRLQEEHTQDAFDILNAGRFDHLDLVVISHQDVDHWCNFISLMKKLTWKLKPPPDEWIRKGNKIFYIDDNETNEFQLNLQTNSVIYQKYLYMRNIGFRGFIIANICLRTSAQDVIDSLSISFTCNEGTFILTANKLLEKIWLNLYLGLKCTSDYCANNLQEIFTECERLVEDFQLTNKAAHAFNKILIHLNGVLCQMFTDIPSLINIYSLEQPRYFPIKKLILGGADCGQQYEYFKLSCKVFVEFWPLISDTSIFLFNGSATHRRKIINLELNADAIALVKHGSVYKNATSVIVVFNFLDNDVLLFPGDATVHTFKSLSAILDEYPLNISLLLAPHHGSDQTSFAYTNRKHKTLKEDQPFWDLLQAHKPELVFVSALKARYHHPGDRFINCLGDAHVACLTTESNCNGGKALIFPVPLPTNKAIPDVAMPALRLPPDDKFIPYGGFNL